MIKRVDVYKDPESGCWAIRLGYPDPDMDVTLHQQWLDLDEAMEDMKDIERWVKS